VLLASDGSEALKVAVEQGPFALFILDVVMPRVTGEEVRANESFIEKPVSVRALLEAVSMSLFGDMRGLTPYAVTSWRSGIDRDSCSIGARRRRRL
jgi:hypothetical protein